MKYLEKIKSDGFLIINSFYSKNDVNKLISIIEEVINMYNQNITFRKSDDLFAIRQFHKEIPQALKVIFNQKMKDFIDSNFGSDFFITKSIYFDKPEASNWFVAYHQDLTISVNKKMILDNYKNWTIKQNQFAVQPPKEILENNFTIRIHLDDTSLENGALKVINKSHLNGIVRTINIENQVETICEVDRGGIMIMKPLLFHASNKTTNNKRRRVIHLEFSNQNLAQNLQWAEKLELQKN
jgi:ectoine hydroxylase-related dioxygenase (phytanoyl-CoA dioxygenase family)